MFVHLLKHRLVTPVQNITSFQFRGRRVTGNGKGTEICIIILLLAFFYPTLIFFTVFLAWIFCIDFLSSLFLKSGLSAEPPLLHRDHQCTSRRRGGLGRDAAETLDWCDSPTHRTSTSTAPSSSTHPLPKPQLLLLILEMSLFCKHWCPAIYHDVNRNTDFVFHLWELDGGWKSLWVRTGLRKTCLDIAVIKVYM